MKMIRLIRKWFQSRNLKPGYVTLKEFEKKCNRKNYSKYLSGLSSFWHPLKIFTCEIDDYKTNIYFNFDLTRCGFPADGLIEYGLDQMTKKFIGVIFNLSEGKIWIRHSTPIPYSFTIGFILEGEKTYITKLIPSPKSKNRARRHFQEYYYKEFCPALNYLRLQLEQQSKKFPLILQYPEK